MSSIEISHIGFLTPGNYTDERPLDGLDDTLRLFEFAEVLGFDSAWVRQRHLEHGISSAAAFLGAATQRTKTIQLGTGSYRSATRARFASPRISRPLTCFHGAG